jgi:probable rRNA maturation factor
MKRRDSIPSARGVELVNRQKGYRVQTATILAFALKLQRRLQLGKKKFSLCFVDDNAVRSLNRAYRGQDKSTDVLSFPWNEPGRPVSPPALPHARRNAHNGAADFLGEVVISAPAARRNAAAEGHSVLNEIRWLILHGVLHLLGYDHERDKGEMVALELALREQLEVTGRSPIEKSKSKGKTQKSKGKAESV